MSPSVDVHHFCGCLAICGPAARLAARWHYLRSPRRRRVAVTATRRNSRARNPNILPRHNTCTRPSCVGNPGRPSDLRDHRCRDGSPLRARMWLLRDRLLPAIRDRARGPPRALRARRRTPNHLQGPTHASHLPCGLHLLRRGGRRTQGLIHARIDRRRPVAERTPRRWPPPARPPTAGWPTGPAGRRGSPGRRPPRPHPGRACPAARPACGR